jgi:mediator of RNA polymerase II transcription subunit 18
MHELVSYSQLQALREEQVLNILAGVTGTQPVEISEQRLIFAQVKVPEVAVNKKVRPLIRTLMTNILLMTSIASSKQATTSTDKTSQLRPTRTPSIPIRQ